jgi:hypothetical protein
MGLIHHFAPKMRQYLQEGKEVAETNQARANQHAEWLNEDLREIAEQKNWAVCVQVKDIHNFGRSGPTTAEELIGSKTAGDK